MEEYAVTSVDGAFARSREWFESIVAGLDSPRTNVVTHAELEERIGCQGRELLRCLLQDHLDLRTAREVRHAAITGADAVVIAARWNPTTTEHCPRCSARSV